MHKVPHTVREQRPQCSEIFINPLTASGTEQSHYFCIVPFFKLAQLRNTVIDFGGLGAEGELHATQSDLMSHFD